MITCWLTYPLSPQESWVQYALTTPPHGSVEVIPHTCKGGKQVTPKAKTFKRPNWPNLNLIFFFI